MISPDGLDIFFAEMAGGSGPPNMLLRDVASDIGWRPWTMEDTRRLWGLIWDTKAGSKGDSQGPVCYNLKEVSEAVGVSVHTVQGWLRRGDSPLPHIRQGRRIVVVGAVLEEWLREESLRRVAGGVSNCPTAQPKAVTRANS